MENNQFNRTLDLLESTSTNFTVEKMPLVSTTGISTGSFGIFRTDKNQWLGTVGPDYTPLQNSVLAETLTAAADRLGLSNERGGSFKNGLKVYYQIPMKDKTIGSDTIKSMLTVVNSHDSSQAIAFGSTGTVIICQNTFYKAYKNLERIRHTSTAEERIRIAMEGMEATIAADVLLYESFEKMVDVPVNNELINRVNVAMFGKEPVTSNSRRNNQLKQWNETLEFELSRHGESAWGLLNGVTYYTNHIATTDRNGKQTKNPTEAVMSGTGFNRNNNSYNTIMDWIDNNIATPILF